MFELEVPYVVRALPENVTPPERGVVHGSLTRRAWLSVLLCGPLCGVLGLALGYVLSGQPSFASVQAKLSAKQATVRLRIDYQMREATLCAGRSSHCRRVHLGYR